MPKDPPFHPSKEAQRINEPLLNCISCSLVLHTAEDYYVSNWSESEGAVQG